MKFVRLIDENGLFLEDAFVEGLTDRTIETPCPEGFYRPKWNGEIWVEGLTQAEIDAITAGAVSEPTLEERVDKVETDVDEVVTILAAIEGVTL